MNLEEIGLVQLSITEIQETEGGFLHGTIIGVPTVLLPGDLPNYPLTPAPHQL